MRTLAEIEAATDALSPEQKEELLRFLATRLHPAKEEEKKPANSFGGAARLVAGPDGTLLLEAPPGAPPMTAATVKRMLEDFP